MADQLEILGQWINTEIAKNEAYHNHKETMAWTATAIWMAAAGFLLINPPRWLFQERTSFTVVFIAMMGLVLWFANAQFCLRWTAADRTTALRMAMCEVCRAIHHNGRGTTLPSRRFVPFVMGFPRLVGEHLIPGHTIPDTTRAIKDILPGRGTEGDFRWRTEIATYLAIMVATAAVLYRVWRHGGCSHGRYLVG